MTFERVSYDNGRWGELLNQWEQEATTYGENFDDYMPASIEAIRPLAEEAQVLNAGVYGVRSESRYLGLCQLNAAFLPGYQGKVLRVRHITFSPKYDYDEGLSVEDYATVLSDVFIGAYSVSGGEMPAPHMKFHFRSPAEKVFFDRLKEVLREHDAFASVEMRGAWLYIAKAKA